MAIKLRASEKQILQLTIVAVEEELTKVSQVSKVYSRFVLYILWFIDGFVYSMIALQ